MSTSPRSPVVVKIGGSLMGDPALASVLAALLGAERPVVLVPGGGIFAEAVRQAQQALGFSDRLAHRLAIQAMGGFAAVLAEREPRLLTVGRRTDIGPAQARGRVPVWDASEVLDGVPGMAETWDVTSDSLAAWLAAEIDAEAVVLIKSGSLEPEPRDAASLAAQGIVDRAFPDQTERLRCPIVCVGREGWADLAAILRDPARSSVRAAARRPTAA